jgi:hypothetical protein
MNRTLRVPRLSAGLHDSRNPTLLRDGEAADILNLDLNGESLSSAGGQLKFNNQRAPRSGIRTRIDPGQNPLRIAQGKSVPVRGYGYIPYSDETDIGGQYIDISSQFTFGNQRGGAFDLRISFQVPPEERLFRKNRLGKCAPADTSVSELGFDEALFESFQIVQKGGDRTSAMSWALGVVNLGDEYQQVTGQSPSKRVSNYALVFMWLDAPRWGRYDPNELPYWAGTGTQNEVETQAGADNTYGTMAYRAVVFDVFVEPGVTYHTSLQLQRDTGSTAFNSGTGYTTATWNGDGILRLTVKDSLGNTFEKGYDEDGGSLSGAYVLLGPEDSLDYLCRYGVRWHGRDAMYLGLGMRFAPWNGAGFIPFGQDAAPLENGGFRMTDLSCKAPLDLWPGDAVMPTWRVDSGGQIACNHGAGIVATTSGAGGGGGGGRLSSKLGGNLLKFEGTATSQAYRSNLFKHARPWLRNDGSTTSVSEGGPTISFDALGYPLEIVENVQRATTYLFRTEKTLEGSWYRSGTYVIEYDGTGKIGALLDGAPVSPTSNTSPYDHAGAQTPNASATRANRVHFSVTTPSSAGVIVTIIESDSADPVRNMRCYHSADEVDLYAGASEWDATLVSDWSAYDYLRFMDAGHINSSTVGPLDLALTSDVFTWEDKKRGFPIQAAVDLCNEVGVGCHYPIPHIASQSQALLDFIFGYAKANLDNAQKFKPEISNECWNGAFSQTIYFQAIGFGLGDSSLTGSGKAFQEGARAYSDRVAAMVSRLDVIYGLNQVGTNVVKMAGGWIIEPTISWNHYVLSWNNLGFDLNTIEVAPYAPASPQGVQFCVTNPPNPTNNSFLYVEDSSVPKLCTLQLDEDSVRALLVSELSLLRDRCEAVATHAGTYGITAGAYEAGIQTAPDFNFEIGPNKGVTTTADEETFFGPAIALQDTVHQSTWMRGFLYDLLVTVAEVFEGTISLFTTHGVGNRFGYYGIQRYPGDTTSQKYLAVTDYQSPAVGREQPVGRQGAYPNPWGPNNGNGGVQPWAGLGGESGGNYNPAALRGYTVAWVAGDSLAIRGMRARVDELTGTSGSPAYAEFSTLDTLSGAAVSEEGPAVIFPFRWNQRELVLSDFRIYSGPVDLSDARALQQLEDGYDGEDDLDPGQAALLGCWPLDDADGGVLRELVSGRDGYLAPMTLAQDRRGSRGSRRLFLSGEGEALALDLSEHPIAKRALEQMLSGDSQGFAIELTCEIPEASYALGNDFLTETNTEHPRFVPNLVSWDFKDPEGTGLSGEPLPLIQMGPRSARAVGAGAFNTLDVPIGFGVLYASESDQEGSELTSAVVHADTQANPTYQFSREARWVGQTVTLQVGVQPTANVDEYQVYLAMYPAELFLETDGSERAEAAYFTTATIGRKDVARSVVTLGGEHDIRGLGYLEASMRVILDEVRIFAAPAPGKLPAVSGGEAPQGEGKILSSAIPARELDASELLEPLGPGVRTATVTEGSPLVDAPGGSAFSTKPVEDTTGGVEGAYLRVAGDEFQDLEEEALGATRPEFYYVERVSSSGSQLTLATAYADPSRRNAAAGVLRLFGYSSLAVDLSLKPLTLGGGAGYDPATTKGTDAQFSDLVPNRSPIDQPFSVRVFNPIGTGSIQSVQPAWVRGLKAPRHNPILGMHGTGDKLLVAAQGAMFEADDRWRREGPLPALQRSLAFRGVRGDDGVLYPEAMDCLEIDGNVRASLSATDFGAGTRTFKVWYRPSTLENESVLLWFGSKASDPGEAPSALEGNGGQYMLRVRNGQVEFVVFSDANIDNTAVGPDRGVYVARSRGRLRSQDWNLIVVQIGQSGSPVFLDKPTIFVNGKPRTVTVNYLGWDGANRPTGSQWIPQPTAPSGASVLVGCAHDAVSLPAFGEPFVRGAVNGPELVPDTVQGYIHPAGGLIGPGLAIGALSTAVEAHDPSADPTFGTPIIQLNLDEGAGHLVEVTGTAAQLEPQGRKFGVIRSHPLLSRFHELGSRSQAASFATYGDRTFCANGGRPVVERDGKARFVGLQQPTFPPKFNILKRPLWVSNVPGSDATQNGPLVEGNHYSTFGNNYLSQAASSEMDWESGDTWVVKMRFRLSKTSGTMQLWGQRNSKQAGRAIEIVDGRVRITWYDSALKQNVWIETNKAVVEPGFVHYLYMRKAFPTGGDAGNWSNSYTTGSQSGDSNDMLVVRRFMQEDVEDTLLNYPTFAAVTDGATHAAVSFTTQDADTVSGSPATGQVVENMTLDRSAGSVVSTNGTFHPDMLYCFLWVDGDNDLYRISEYVSATEVSVVKASNGSTPSGSAAGAVGGVYTGVSLVKSEGFDESKSPDKGSYDIEVLGSQIQANPLNGLSKLVGEVWDFGYYTGSGEDFFEVAQTVRAETGTDTFADTIYSGNTLGPLLFDVAGDTFASFASTDPNVDLEVAPIQATSNVQAASMFWNQVEQITLFSGSRRVRTTFYDPDNDLESNPSPELFVFASSEDADNPSGEAALEITGLPVSPDGVRIHRRVYVSLTGVSEMFLVAEIPDNTSTSVTIAKSEIEIASGQQLLFNNSAPPRCGIVAASQRTMVYGQIEGQPDGFIFSVPYRPESVPLVNIQVLDTGDSQKITAMADLSGNLVVFKANAMSRYQLLGSTSRSKTITRGGAGCVGPNAVAALDDRLYFMSQRGPFVYTGSSLPVYLGERMEGFTQGLDSRRLPLMHAGINRARNQAVFTAWAAGQAYPTQRFALEFDHAYAGTGSGQDMPAMHRISLYEGLRCTALGQVDELDGGLQRFVGGTVEGYVLWMDRSDTPLQGMKQDPLPWGLSQGTVFSATTSSVILTPVSGAGIDSRLDGARGLPVRWRDGSTDYEAWVGFAANSTLYFEDAVAVTPAGTVSVGAARLLWRSRHFNAGEPDQTKRLIQFNTTRKPGSGTLNWQLFTDFDESTNADSGTLILSDSQFDQPVQSGECNHWQLELRSSVEDAGVGLELFDLAFVFQGADPETDGAPLS